jgi:hypothetical protein
MMNYTALTKRLTELMKGDDMEDYSSARYTARGGLVYSIGG